MKIPRQQYWDLLAQQIVSVLATYVSENVGWTATNALRQDVASHCLRLDMSSSRAWDARGRRFRGDYVLSGLTDACNW